MGEILLVLSTATLGIFLGSQITEAVLFVPYWKALSADDFFSLHKTYGKKIYQFFAPLTISATFIPLIAAGFNLVQQTDNQILWGILGAATLAFFSTFFIYFKAANQSFADRSISDEQLPKALQTWGNWHWLRIGFECIAFGVSLYLMIG